VEGIDIADDRVRGLETSSGYLRAPVVVLAIGHSARDTYEALLRQRVPMQAKPFQLGLRIEHPQEQVNRHKYGKRKYLEILGAADYTLTARGRSRPVHLLHVRGGDRHSQRFGARNVLHERHEQFAARYPVCQFGTGGDD
jgi:glycine/D-amino acid oxidase-like deaminating enzyme